jgi:hypothetical protein
MRTQWRQLCSVFHLGTRIGGKIGCAVELLWIDEQRHDHPVGLFERGTHQAEMPFMQGTHSGHHSNAGCFATPSRNDRAKIRHGPDNRDIHAASPPLIVLG